MGDVSPLCPGDDDDVMLTDGLYSPIRCDAAVVGGDFLSSTHRLRERCQIILMSAAIITRDATCALGIQAGVYVDGTQVGLNACLAWSRWKRERRW